MTANIFKPIYRHELKPGDRIELKRDRVEYDVAEPAREGYIKLRGPRGTVRVSHCCHAKLVEHGDPAPAELEPEVLDREQGEAENRTTCLFDDELPGPELTSAEADAQDALEAGVELTLFTFEGHAVRTGTIADETVWIAADVCAVLDLSGAPSQHLRRLDDDEKGVIKAHTPGGKQRLTYVTESGLWTLIVRSNSPKAKPLRRWVTHEVLPAIRRTGSYSVAGRVELTDQVAGHIAQVVGEAIGRAMAPVLELMTKLAGRIEDVEQRIDEGPAGPAALPSSSTSRGAAVPPEAMSDALVSAHTLAVELHWYDQRGEPLGLAIEGAAQANRFFERGLYRREWRRYFEGRQLVSGFTQAGRVAFIAEVDSKVPTGETTYVPAANGCSLLVHKGRRFAKRHVIRTAAPGGAR